MAYEKRKVILTVAQTGGFQGKEQNPNLPEQPDEIIASAYDCYNAGASIVHVHARDKAGHGSNDSEIFAEINSGIRAKCPLVIQNSMAPATRANADRDDGLGVLAMKDTSCLPEMCSLDCSILTTEWDGVTMVHMWTRDWLIGVAKRLVEMNIKAELEVFDVEAVEDVFRYMAPAGVLPDPISMTFVMGMDRVSQGAIRYTQQNLDFMLSLIPQDKEVSVTTMVIGAPQLQGTLYGLLKGTNVRTGMEDNINYSYHRPAKSNAELVERMVGIIRAMDMEVATPDEARAMLRIPKR